MENPIKLLNLDHVVLRVQDLEAMLTFYCGVLGCSLERRRDDIGLIQLRAGDCLIDLVPVQGKLGSMGGAAPGVEGRNLDHLCLRVGDFNADAITTWLASNNVQFDEPATRYGAEGNGPSIYVTDPERNVVELKAAREA